MCQNLGLTLKEIVKLLVRTPIPKVRKRRISRRKSGSRINYLAPRPLPLEQPRSNSGFIWNTKNYPSNGYFSFFQMFSLFSKKAAVIYRWIELEVPFSIFLLKSWKKRPSQFFFWLWGSSTYLWLNKFLQWLSSKETCNHAVKRFVPQCFSYKIEYYLRNEKSRPGSLTYLRI